MPTARQLPQTDGYTEAQIGQQAQLHLTRTVKPGLKIQGVEDTNLKRLSVRVEPRDDTNTNKDWQVDILFKFRRKKERVGNMEFFRNGVNKSITLPSVLKRRIGEVRGI